MSIVRTLWMVGIAAGLAGCSSTPTARQLGQDAVAAMGGVERVQGVKTLTMKGGMGTRYRHGQTVKVGEAEPAAMLKNVTETLDRANNRAVSGLRLPHKITVRKLGQPYSEVQYSSASVNDAAAETIFAIPAAANEEVAKAVAAGEYSPVALTKIADGVYFARAERTVPK